MTDEDRRDYRADMNELLRLKVPTTNFVPAVVAAEIAGYLRKNDRDLLDGWLDSMAEVFLARAITLRAQSARSRAQHQRKPQEFAEAAARFEDCGDEEELSAFTALFVVNEDNLRRAVGDMTKRDHLFVAGQYTQSANSARMEAAFHRALAKRIPEGRTTSDVMDEDEYLRLRASIVKDDPR